MTNKEKYARSFFEDTPIFLQPHVLDAVCGNDWDVAIVSEKDKVLGYLPYYFQKGKFGTYILQPPLVQFSGPWLTADVRKNIHLQNKVLKALIDGLNNFAFYDQCWHHSINNWLPFYWEGFQQTTRYTYILRKELLVPNIESNYKTNHRQSLKKAKRALHIKVSEDIELLIELAFSSLKRKNVADDHDRNLIRNLFIALKNKDQVSIITAFDPNDVAVAAGMFIYDKTTMYYLYGGFTDQGKKDGGMNLVIHHALTKARKLNIDFDFEGSMNASVGNFFRSFGSELKGYYKVSKANSKMLSFIQNIKAFKQ